MKRILVTGGAQIGKAGVATIVYKWGQNFDESTATYDYLMQSGLPETKFQEAIKEKGGIMYTPDKPLGYLGIVKWVEHIIREHQYKVIHINTDSAYIAAAYIFAAKRAGIERIFVHSHCTQIDAKSKAVRFVKTVLHKLCKQYVCRNTEMFLACSELAGIWMFGNDNVTSDKYKTIYNGVESGIYRYNPTTRSEYRTQLNIGNEQVIGHIGRFSYQKNHELLLKIFEQYLKTDSNCLLMLVGVGELESHIRGLVEEKGISDRVLFMGLRNDVPQLLSAMDVLVMPSRFEGLPVTMVEAQMAALPCVVSTNITREAKFISEVAYVDDENLDAWVSNISAMLKVIRENIDVDSTSCFDIKNAAEELQEILTR